MRVPRLQRRWVALALVAAMLFVVYRQLDTAMWIFYYRVVDDHTMLVGPSAAQGHRCASRA